MTDEQLTALIQEAINKSAGELRKEMLIIDTVYEDLEKVKVEQKRLEGTCDDDYSVIHDELVEQQRQERDSLTNTVSETIKQQDEAIKNLESSLFENMNSLFKEYQLEQKIYIQDELLRINNHINQKLNTLKGEKGDKGDKGEKGNDGLINGASKWEDGAIAKEGQAFTHRHGLWLCQSKETAREPAEGDDWILLANGLHSLDLVGGMLWRQDSTGGALMLGRTTPSHEGEFDPRVEYEMNDIVTYRGSTFYSLEDDNNNVPPSNSWRILAQKGSKGNKGEPGVVNIKDIVEIVREVVKDELKEDE